MAHIAHKLSERLFGIKRSIKVLRCVLKESNQHSHQVTVTPVIPIHGETRLLQYMQNFYRSCEIHHSIVFMSVEGLRLTEETQLDLLTHKSNQSTQQIINKLNGQLGRHTIYSARFIPTHERQEMHEDLKNE